MSSLWRGKEMKITIPTCKRDLQLKDVSKTKEQILDAINREIETAVEHFKIEEGGWKLRKDFIQSEILRNILGFSVEDEINQAFINEGLVIEYAKEGVFVRTEEEYHPIYMNERTGKLHVIENSDDKSYTFKFRECDGYVFIGRL
jgi:hypothetical protein